MKKLVLLLMIALFVAVNVTVLTWGGFDAGKVLAKEDCN